MASTNRTGLRQLHAVRRGWPVVLFVLFVPALGLSAPWKLVTDKDGIKVWQRKVERSSFVQFRGRALIEAPLMDVAAVLRDTEREHEWMESCSEARTLRYRSATDFTVYLRTKSPVFFVDDRDVVYESKMRFNPRRRTILVEVRTTEDQLMPPIEGVVRMPQLEAYWRFTELAEGRTRVEYQVLADPGGELPPWLVNWASSALPYETLQGLRRQVKAEGYEEHRLILERAFEAQHASAP